MAVFQRKGRDEMKGYNVYSKVHQMREAGFSQRAIAKALSIHRKTVKRYWDMDVEQYEHNARKIVRIRNLDTHRDQIVFWLREYPSLSAAQVCDWLKEHYEEDHAERTVSRYVKELREEYRLPRHPNPRSYEAVAELPMGQQMQVDFGQTTLKNVDGTWTKVYVASGKNVDRKDFKAMMAFVRAGDTVIVESISRIARNTRDLLTIISNLTEKGVEFVSLKENIDTTTPHGRFMLTIFGALAELERESILERQREGIEIAKAEGKYKGRKPVAVNEAKFRAVCARWRAGEITATVAMQEVGLKPNTFYRRVKELNL